MKKGTENCINTCRFPPFYLFKYIILRTTRHNKDKAAGIAYSSLLQTFLDDTCPLSAKINKNKLNQFLESENVLPPLSPFIITCWNHCLAVWAPAPQTLVNNSMTLMSSSALNSLSFLSSPLSAISQILSASLVPTPGKFLASCE